MGYIRLEKDSDGIVELIFDQPGLGKSSSSSRDVNLIAPTSSLQKLVQRPRLSRPREHCS